MASENTIVIGFLGFLAGVLVGAVAGLLFAPMSGADLRARAREESLTQRDHALVEWNKAMTEMRLEMEKVQHQMREYQTKAVDDAIARLEKLQPKTGEEAG
jgi:gas vesicle protein